jgi:hypothetical protein
MTLLDCVCPVVGVQIKRWFHLLEGVFLTTPSIFVFIYYLGGIRFRFSADIGNNVIVGGA